VISCRQFGGAEIANLSGIGIGVVFGVGPKQKEWAPVWVGLELEEQKRARKETGHKSCVLAGVAIELVWASTGTNDDCCWCPHAVVRSGAFNPARLDLMAKRSGRQVVLLSLRPGRESVACPAPKWNSIFVRQIALHI